MKYKMFNVEFPQKWIEKQIPKHFPDFAVQRTPRECIVEQPLKLDTCWNCRTAGQRFRCKGCSFAFYCSQVCQVEHWRYIHSTHCKYLAGEKIAPGSVHTKDCQTCKIQPLDYNQLHKRKNVNSLACSLKITKNLVDYFKRTAFIQNFIRIAKL